MKQVFLIGAIAIGLLACKRKSAFWNSDWSVPIVSDSLTLENIIPDSLLTVSNGNYVLDLNQTLYEFRLSDFVDIPDTTIRNSFNFAIGLSVPPNTSFVNNVDEHVLDVGDAQLKQIIVKEGGINVKVFNPIGTKSLFTIELPGITKNGITLSRNFTAPAGTHANPGVVSSYVDLSGYTADLTGVNGTDFNIIQSRMLVKSDPDGPTVNVSTTDTIFFEASLQSLKLDYARGYFGNILQTNESVTTISAFEKIQEGSIDIDALDLNVIVENGFKVGGKFRINAIKDINTQGEEVDLTHPIVGNWITINSATGTGGAWTPSTSTYNFNSGNSNLEQFVENHGSQVVFDYQVNLNPWGNTSGSWDEIYDEHPLRLKMEGTVPLSIALDNLVLMDTFNLALHQDPNKTHIRSGMFLLNSMNAFPFKGEIEFALLNSSYQTIAVLPANGNLESSLTGTLQNGIMVKGNTIEIPIPESVLNQLNKAKYCTIRVRLNSPDATNTSNVQVSIPVNAYITFDLKSKFILETHI